MKKKSDLGYQNGGGSAQVSACDAQANCNYKSSSTGWDQFKTNKTNAEYLTKATSGYGKDWQIMSQEWQGQLDQQIMMFLQLGQKLDQCIGCGCLSLEQYLLQNPEDCLGEEAMGAHFQEILFLMNQKNESEF